MLKPAPPAEAPAAQKAPPPPPQPAAPVNMAMRGFAGITQPAPQPAPSIPKPPPEEDLAAQVARMNEAAMGEAPPEPEPEPEKRGGIFARLGRHRAPAPSEPPSEAGMGDAAMTNGSGDAVMTDASMGNGSMPDASMGDAEMGIDPALAAQAFPEEHPASKRGSAVTLGWLVLAVVVAGILGTFALAPSAVMSVLPGAARLYALFGVPVGSHGLAFEGVRYGWNNEGGQTVLEVQGDVVNLTSTPVDVPTVVIALQDEKGDEISEWTTEIGEDELAGGEHAPFLRQIPSPPSNVRSVKVRFAKAE